MPRSDPKIDIPAEFWQTVSREEVPGIFERDGLNADQCTRLWRLLDRRGRPPKFLRILVSDKIVKN